MTTRILAAALLTLGGALLAPAACDTGMVINDMQSSVEGARSAPCPGRCLPLAASALWSEPLFVWAGDARESPVCEELGLVHVVEGGTRPRADLTCPDCACERRPCTDGLGFQATGDPECVPMRMGWHADAAGEGECMRYRAPQEPGFHAWRLEYPDGLCRAFRKDRDVERSADLWEEAFLACRPRSTAAHACSDPFAEGCVSPYKEPLERGFRACVRYEDVSAMDSDAVWDDTSCPPDYPDKLIGYLRVEGGCGECTCELREGTGCSVEVSVYGDARCTQLLASKVMTDDSCLTLPAPSRLGGVVVHERDAGTAGCEPRSGPPQGSPAPAGREMFCCQPGGT